MRALRCAIPLLAFALPVLLAPPARGQMIPPHATLRDFEPLGMCNLEVGGAVLPGVKLFQSSKAGSSVLMTGTGLAASYLINVPQRAVQRLENSKVAVGADGLAFVLADAALDREGAFSTQANEVVFTIQGKPARLREKPYLLGLQAGKDLLHHDVTYAFRAKQYKLSSPAVKALQQAGEPVRVRIFFGNWCSHCREMVPRVLRLADALAGSPIRFEYYGLPPSFGNEPEAKRLGITGVPTGVVYRGGRELGRLSGGEISIPELGIRKILDSAAKKSR